METLVCFPLEALVVFHRSFQEAPAELPLQINYYPLSSLFVLTWTLSAKVGVLLQGSCKESHFPDTSSADAL